MEEKKKSNFMFFCLLTIGIGKLMAFSTLSQPADYWNEVLPDKKGFMFDMMALFMISDIVFLSILIFFFSRLSSSIIKMRMIFGFCGQFVFLALVPLSHFFPFSSNAKYDILLILTSFIGILTAFIESVAFSLVSSFSVKHQETLQIGLGISTFISNIFRVITKLAFSRSMHDIFVSSYIYFALGCFILLLCVYCTLHVCNQQDKDLLSNVDSHHPIDTENGERSLLKENIDNFEENKNSNVKLEKIKVIKRTFSSGLAIAFLFLSTFMVWPSLVSKLKAPNFPSLIENMWWSQILLFLFSLLDIIGRFMVPIRFGIGKKSIWIPIVLRVCLMPIIILNANDIAFTHEAFTIVSIAILGWTNGFCGSLSIILMNEHGETEEEKRYIGSLSSFYLNSGLVLGVTLGILLKV